MYDTYLSTPYIYFIYFKFCFPSGQFGKAGQVKHTHLAAEDTTDYSSAWAQTNRQNLKQQERMAGVNIYTH